MGNSENDKFMEEKERKFKFFAEKIKSGHNNELRAFNNKTQGAYGEFKKNRAIEFDK